MENNGWTRRRFVATVPMVVAGAVLAEGMPFPQGQAVAVKWSSGTEPARTKVPANATDCHHHIYDARFPADPTTQLRPGDALIPDYRMLQKRLGTSRNVIVQPSTYGVDNSLLVESLKTFGPAARGIAVVNDKVTNEELKRLDAAGVRGVRFNLAQGGGTTWEMVAPMAKRFADIGWHIQMNTPVDGLLAHKELLSGLPCPIVFDHLARIPVEVGPQHPAFGFIVELMQKRKAWLKLSGAYILSKVGAPTYADSGAIAKAFVEKAPERLVWGSDWPHPTAPGNQKPDDAILLDLLAVWAPKKSVRNRILVDNPAKLYRFA